MDSDAIDHASRLWRYLSSFRSTAPVDAIVVCCSYDLRVCDYACELIASGHSRKLVLSGNTGHWSRHIWSRPEAQVFRERANANGIPDDEILIEDKATNFGENLRYSRELLNGVQSVALITKPAAVLRVMLAAEVQWPDANIHVDCPEIDFPSEVSNIVGVLGAIDEMVGDIQRIQEYPKYGYQAVHAFPPEILESWRFLIASGFTRHLIPESETRG